jgi:hypothetical protein
MLVPEALPTLMARGRVLVQPEGLDVSRGTRTALIYNLAPLSGRLILPSWVQAIQPANPDSREILVAPAPLAIAVFRTDLTQPPQPRIGNSGFESWTHGAAETSPEGWEYFQGGVRGRLEPVLEPDDVREGRRALRVYPSSQGPSYVRLKLPAEPLRGRWALLRVWTKSANVEADAVQIDLQTDDGGIAVGSYSNSGSWEPVEVRHWIPANANTMLVTINVAAGASAPAVFDDIALLAEAHSPLPASAPALSRLIAIERMRGIDIPGRRRRARPVPAARLEVPLERWDEFIEHLRGGAWRWADIAPARADQVAVLAEVLPPRGGCSRSGAATPCRPHDTLPGCRCRASTRG